MEYNKNLKNEKVFNIFLEALVNEYLSTLILLESDKLYWHFFKTWEFFSKTKKVFLIKQFNEFSQENDSRFFMQDLKISPDKIKKIGSLWADNHRQQFCSEILILRVSIAYENYLIDYMADENSINSNKNSNIFKFLKKNKDRYKNILESSLYKNMWEVREMSNKHKHDSNIKEGYPGRFLMKEGANISKNEDERDYLLSNVEFSKRDNNLINDIKEFCNNEKIDYDKKYFDQIIDISNQIKEIVNPKK